MNANIVERIEDDKFIEIVKNSKSVNEVAKKIGFKHSPGKTSRKKINNRIIKLGITLGENQKIITDERITPRKMTSNYSTSNAVGRVGEKYFEYICAKHDISCLKEDSSCEHYDYIIDVSGKLLRIQVKTTEFLDINTQKRSAIFYIQRGNFYNNNYGRKRKYNSTDSDYYFLYNIEANMGFLIKPTIERQAIRIWIKDPLVKYDSVIIGNDYTFDKVISEISKI